MEFPDRWILYHAATGLDLSGFSSNVGKQALIHGGPMIPCWKIHYRKDAQHLAKGVIRR